MRPSWREKRVIRNWQQMVSGDLQFMQEPVLAQGVLSPKRWAFMGAATFLARFMAASCLYADFTSCTAFLEEDYTTITG